VIAAAVAPAAARCHEQDAQTSTRPRWSRVARTHATLTFSSSAKAVPESERVLLDVWSMAARSSTSAFTGRPIECPEQESNLRPTA
jgi:hypothetical protein